MRRTSFFSLFFVAVAVLVVGTAAAVFGIADAVLLSPLPFPQPERLAVVRAAARDRSGMALSFREIQALVGAHGLGRVAGYKTGQGPVSAGRREVFGLYYLAAPDFFSVLGVTPARGRGFAPGDAGAAVAVVTPALCRALFAAERCQGRLVKAAGRQVTVAGVMPHGFRFGAYALTGDPQVAIWFPSTFPAAQSHPGSHDFFDVLRVAPGLGLHQADAALAALAIPGDGNWRLYAEPLAADWLASARPVVDAALVAALALLLLCAANLSLFFLFRVHGRGRELAVRAAVGARPRQVAAEVVAEIGTLTALAFGGSLPICWWLLRLLRGELAGVLPRVSDAQMGGNVVLACAMAAVLVTVVSALAPALGAWRLGRAERIFAPSAARDPRSPLAGRLLTGAQVALAIALVGTCAAMAGAVHGLIGGDLGFDVTHSVSLEFAFGSNAYASSLSTLQRALAVVAKTPGVSAAAVATHPPLTGDRYAGTFWTPGHAGRDAEFQLVGPAYFRALGVPLIAGRGFRRGDAMKAPLVAIVNEAFARAYLPSAVLGAKLKFELPPDDWRSVVGVVGNVRDISPAQPPEPELYLPAAQSAGWMNTIVLRATVPTGTLTARLLPRLQRLGAGFQVRLLTGLQAIQYTARMQSFLARLFAAFGLLALAVASLGVFGLASDATARGRRALAVRLALGATRAQIRRAVLRRFASTAAVAGLIGYLLAVGLEISFHSLILSISPGNPWILAATGATLLVVALAGCALPAMRAARLDPAAELRNE